MGDTEARSQDDRIELDWVGPARRAGRPRRWGPLGALGVVAAGLLLGAPAGGAPNEILLEKTVGLDAETCATSDTLAIGSGEEVTYCYTVTNDSDVTLTTHDLVDDQLGVLLTAFPFTLGPGASAFLTQSAVLTGTTTNVATWTASNGVETFSEIASATVDVVDPVVTLEKTVGTDLGTCGTDDALTTSAGATVVYCYTVTNDGVLTTTRHDLVDDQLGTILADFPFGLAPGASAFITASAVLTETTTNVGSWTARDDLGNESAPATDTVVVTVVAPTIVMTKTVGTDLGTCASTDLVDVVAGTTVVYCYSVENTSGTTLTRHDLVDDQLGTILADFPFGLAPGASAFITASAVITEPVLNIGSWTASNPDVPTASAPAIDTASVSVAGVLPTTTSTTQPTTTSTQPTTSTTSATSTTAGPTSTTGSVSPTSVARSGGSLPRTGDEAGGGALLGLGMLLVGGGVLALRRPRVA